MLSTTWIGPVAAAIRDQCGGAAGNRTRRINGVNCETLILTTRNDGKRRKTTCGYAKGVDGVNTHGRVGHWQICAPSRWWPVAHGSRRGLNFPVRRLLAIRRE